MLHSLALALAGTLPALPPAWGDKDSDRDGLTDFAEVHKYGTDPKSADSDRDGVPDGDWFERREYAYVVRSVVQVLKPVTPEYLTDDFQDARVLSESEDRFELEVVHYPFSTAPDALPLRTRSLRKAAKQREVARWLQPGPTSDWDKQLRKDLVTALKNAEIDVDELDDAELVRRASDWLVRHGKSIDGFTTFSTAFDERGQPYIPDELVRGVNDGAPPTEEDWAGEMSAKGMFERGQRGSCTSSAIYISGCLRALGIPTRTVLCIPLFDANDQREWDMVEERIQQPMVRKTLLPAMERLRGSWASHTFNEVWIDGRWWRLDYSALGVGILRKDRFGMLTHVGTFHDWADADAAATIGRRDVLRLRDPFLDGPNPYSMLSVGEEYGAHLDRGTLPLPGHPIGKLEQLVWFDDPNLPADVQESMASNGRWGLVARITCAGGGDGVRELLDLVDQRIYLRTEGHPELGIGLDPGCWWYKNDHALVYVPFGPSDRAQLVEGADYRVELPNGSEFATLRTLGSLVVTRD